MGLHTNIEPRPPFVQIVNPSDGGVLHWLLKLYCFAFFVALAALFSTAVAVYTYIANHTPEAPNLAEYTVTAPAVSRIYAADGTILGEFASEWRELAAYDELPQVLIDAFLAVEDHQFFAHNGLYLKGILRAAWHNFMTGDFGQGGSTITQQLAKQYLGREKSLLRKAKEALIARRLEARYPKPVILTVYLNQIFLGAGAYGVRAATKRYFGKPLSELTLAEAALLAGLAQAPSRYSPTRNMKRALARRQTVLDKMVKYGLARRQDAAAAATTPLQLAVHRPIFGEISPYYTEHTRRYMTAQYGRRALSSGGYRIETAAEPAVEAIAYENARFGARKQDKRQGWRGPVAHLEGKARELFAARAKKLYGKGPLQPKRRYLALVESVKSQGGKVRVGETLYSLPLHNMSWASPWRTSPAINDELITDARQALSVGDVVRVSKDLPLTKPYTDWYLDGVNPRWTPRMRKSRLQREQKRRAKRVILEQLEHPQVAIFTGDHQTGYVVSIVGGTDFQRSQYNRAIQACRQPGSTYKPIYYSAALDRGYGFDSELNDVPRTEVDPETGQEWTPQNLGGTVDNKVSLEYALVFSKNIPSVDIFKRVGAKQVEAWARRLGFTTPIIADQALALGASCTLLPELARAFAIFARLGRWLDWVYIRRIFDRQGQLVEDHTTFYDPRLSPAELLDRVHATADLKDKQAIPERTAFLTSKLLSQAIRYGFSWVIRQTGIHAAGKTGTSSATMDTSFVAYTSRWLSAVWMGDDLRQRPLGVKDAAYMTVVPLWARYMNEAAQGHPNPPIPWKVPKGVEAQDRGDNKEGSLPMPLIYRKHKKPADDSTDPADPALPAENN